MRVYKIVISIKYLLLFFIVLKNINIGFKGPLKCKLNLKELEKFRSKVGTSMAKGENTVHFLTDPGRDKDWTVFTVD